MMYNIPDTIPAPPPIETIPPDTVPNNPLPEITEIDNPIPEPPTTITMLPPRFDATTRCCTVF